MDDIDLEAYFSDYFESSFDRPRCEFREAPPIENTLSREPDLYDHLLWQLHMSDIRRQRELAELVIGNLDPDGFLVAHSEEIRSSLMDTTRTGPCYAGAEVEAALELVQSFDPPGHRLPGTLRSACSAARREEDEPEDSLARRARSSRRALGAVPEAPVRRDRQDLGVELESSSR